MPRPRRRAFTLLVALIALAGLLAIAWTSVPPARTHVYYCWNPDLDFALPCRYVKAERAV